jgi:hypothetical protein
MAQFSRYQFIPSAKLFTWYISRPFLFKIYGCDLVLNLLDIIGYLSGLCLSARACRVGVLNLSARQSGRNSGKKRHFSNFSYWVLVDVNI